MASAALVVSRREESKAGLSLKNGPREVGFPQDPENPPISRSHIPFKIVARDPPRVTRSTEVRRDNMRGSLQRVPPHFQCAPGGRLKCRSSGGWGRIELPTFRVEGEELTQRGRAGVETERSGAEVPVRWEMLRER